MTCPTITNLHAILAAYDAPAGPSKADTLKAVAACLSGACAAPQCEPSIQPVAAQVEQDAALDSALYDAMVEQLGDLYCCGRVWSAWSYGTMHEDDFSIASEDDDIVSNFVSAARAAILVAKGGAV